MSRKITERRPVDEKTISPAALIEAVNLARASKKLKELAEKAAEIDTDLATDLLSIIPITKHAEQYLTEMSAKFATPITKGGN